MTFICSNHVILLNNNDIAPFSDKSEYVLLVGQLALIIIVQYRIPLCLGICAFRAADRIRTRHPNSIMVGQRAFGHLNTNSYEDICTINLFGIQVVFAGIQAREEQKDNENCGFSGFQETLSFCLWRTPQVLNRLDATWNKLVMFTLYKADIRETLQVQKQWIVQIELVETQNHEMSPGRLF